MPSREISDAGLFRRGRALDRALRTDSAACGRCLAIDAQLFLEHLSRRGAQRKLLYISQGLAAYHAGHGVILFLKRLGLSTKPSVTYGLGRRYAQIGFVIQMSILTFSIEHRNPGIEIPVHPAITPKCERRTISGPPSGYSAISLVSRLGSAGAR